MPLLRFWKQWVQRILGINGRVIAPIVQKSWRHRKTNHEKLVFEMYVCWPEIITCQLFSKKKTLIALVCNNKINLDRALYSRIKSVVRWVDGLTSLKEIKILFTNYLEKGPTSKTEHYVSQMLLFKKKIANSSPTWWIEECDLVQFTIYHVNKYDGKNTRSKKIYCSSGNVKGALEWI